MIQITTTSVSNRRVYDISELCTPPTWETGLDSQPGTLEFSMIPDDAVHIMAGDTIEMKIDGKNIFKGRGFIRSKDKDMWDITAYDNMRYLKNEDTLVFQASSASSRFKSICQTQGLAHKVLDNSSYNCAAVVEDKHTYFSMLSEAIEETRINQGVRYGVWDNYGTLEFLNLNRGITKLLIGDESLMTDYTYEASIDKSYNSVKVLREDRDTGKREVYQARNDRNIELWGKLQMVETISDADLNASQLREQAKVLLAENNAETKTLKLQAIGDLSLRAGNSFTLRIADIQKDNIAKDSLALVVNCKHKFKDGHTMDLEVEVVA